MNARALRTAAFAALVFTLCAQACQLYGCEPARCRPPLDEAGACAADEFCAADGFCKPRPPVGVCAPAAPSDVETLLLHMEIADELGVDAMGDALFGVIPARIIADARGCHAGAAAGSCAIVDAGSANAPAVQPLGAHISRDPQASRRLATTLDVEPLVVDAGATGPLDFSTGLAVEAIFRTPSTPPVDASSFVAAMSEDEGSWQLIVDETGFVAFVAGELIVALGFRNDATWMHVLCTISGQARADDAEDRVLCAVDGRPAFLPAFTLDGLTGNGLGSGAGPLVLGAQTAVDAVAADAAVAVVRVWEGDPFAQLSPAPGSAVERSDALLDAARRRLARYVGLDIRVPPSNFGGGDVRFLLSNSDLGVPRAQPVEHDGFKRFEFVGGGWPRIFHTDDERRGLLLEPTRIDLLDGLFGACNAPVGTRTSLLGRPDACARDAPLSKALDAPPSPFDPGVLLWDEGSEMVFSAFVDAAGAASFRFDVGAPVPACGAADVGVVAGCDVEPFEDGAVRIIYRFAAPGPSFQANFDVDGVVYSPQLELGSDPTSPFVFPFFIEFQPPVSVQTNARGSDNVIATGIGLSNGDSSALRATVVTEGTRIGMTPLLVGDDADFGDRFALLAIESEPGGGPQVNARLVLVDGDTVTDADGVPFNLVEGQAVRFGADLFSDQGGSPIDACSGCLIEPAAASPEAPVQWNVVDFTSFDVDFVSAEAGLLLDADVLSRGTQPLPLPLVIDVRPPQSGCVDGRLPDISFVACAAGACSESDGQAWQGEPAADVAGPSIGERGVGGAFALDLADDNVVELDELYVELRFRTGDDDDGDGDGSGPLLVLSDEGGDTLFAIRVDGDGNAVLEGAGGAQSTIARGVWSASREWHQLACWLGATSRCVLNAAAPLELVDVVEEDGQIGDVDVAAGARIARVELGEAASAVAFARVWSEPRGKPAQEVARLVDARVAASFGFATPSRRGAFSLVEQRATASSVPRVSPADGGGVAVAVGAHWPRVVDVSGGDGADPATAQPAYLVEDGEGLEITSIDMASLGGTTLEMSFAELADGPFFAMHHRTQDGEVEALALEKVASSLRLTGAEIEEAADVPGFDGASLKLALRFGLATLESGGVPRLTFIVNGASISGGNRIVVGDGNPRLQLTRLSVVSP